MRDPLAAGPIIVAVDPLAAAAARDALALGRTLAAAYDAEVRVASVCGERRQVAACTAALADLLAGARMTSSLSILVSASPARALHELCDFERAGALVLGSRRHGGIGPVVKAVMHGGGVPVAVAPSQHALLEQPLTTIGVAFDGSPESHTALEHAQVLAERAGARLERISVEEPDDPATALARASARLGLLVAGSHSNAPLRAVLLGDVTGRLLPIARCPVMIVPRLPRLAETVALPGGMETAAQ